MATPSFLEGGGVAGELVRSIDWSPTPVGPIAGWPESLKTTVGTLLHSRHPMFLWWGPDLVQFYNDAYLPSFGAGKHPLAMGQRGADCWQEIWPIIWPQIDDVMQRAKASWNEDALVPIDRNGRIEEVYWTYGYSPVFDESGGVGGTLVVCTETTGRVVSARRLRTLRALVEGMVLAASTSAVLDAAAGIVAAEAVDIPFALIYKIDDAAREPVLERSLGIEDDERATVDAAFRGRLVTLSTVPGAQPLTAAVERSHCPWPEPATHMFVARIAAPGQQVASGYVLFGLSPRLPFDRAYQDYLRQIAEHLSQAQARIETLQHREAILRDLEDASRAKDQFLAMLGHELRNPLAPILTALQLMRLRGVQGAEKERAVIERQVRHVVRLVDDLLDVSRITRGKIHLKLEPLRLPDVVAKAIEMSSPLIEQRMHRLSVDVPDGLVVEGDANRLSQVIANVLTNAAKYTDPGGDISVRAEPRDGLVQLSIKDSGVGIDPTMLRSVFEPFAQERQDSDRSQGGLGLGLAIVRSLVEAHGGTVTLASEGTGRGTECVMQLPLSVGVSAKPAAVEHRPAAAPGTIMSVLLVDDNVDAAEMMAESLRALGHHVRVAYDGPQALELASDYVPDVALLDLGLPVIDGYEVAARLRVQPGWELVRMVALTGYGLQSDRDRTTKAGFDGHMVKPIDINHLTTMLRSLRS